jgi:type II secretion system protein G
VGKYPFDSQQKRISVVVRDGVYGMAIVPDYHQGLTEGEVRRWPRRLVLAVGLMAVVLVVVGAEPIETSIMLSPLGFAGWVLGLMMVVLGLVDTGFGVVRRRRVERVAMMGYFCALLAVLGPVGYLWIGEGGYYERSPRNKTITTIANMNAALETFYVDTGRYPTTTEGLNALLHAPAGLGGTWKGPYIDGGVLPLDGWGHAFIHQMSAKTIPATFDIVSPGEDGVLGTADDIDRSTTK